LQGRAAASLGQQQQTTINGHRKQQFNCRRLCRLLATAGPVLWLVLKFGLVHDARRVPIVAFLDAAQPKRDTVASKFSRQRATTCQLGYSLDPVRLDQVLQLSAHIAQKRAHPSGLELARYRRERSPQLETHNRRNKHQQ
jgi:hypothetical protein